MKYEQATARDPRNPIQCLRSLPHSVPDPRTRERQRQRVVGRLNALQQELTARRRRRARWATTLAVAAGLAVLVLALWRNDATPPQSLATSLHVMQGGLRVASGRVLTATSGQGLSLSQPVEVEAVETATKLQLPSHSQVSLSSATRAKVSRSINSRGQTLERLDLQAGSVNLLVPPLGGSGRLQVATPHALVEVHGTEFRVQLQRGETHVSVEKGLVSVESPSGRILLRPGQHWSSAPALPTATSPSTVTAPAELSKPAAERRPELKPRKKKTPSAKGSQRPVEKSQLDDENRMLQGVLLAKRAGLRQLALSRIQQLLQTYPQTEAAHNAQVEKFRILQQMGLSTQARQAAENYLAQHPHGFARREAEALVQAP